MRRGLWALPLILLPMLGLAAPGMDAITLTTNADGSQSYSLTIQIVLFMTLLSMLPAALMLMTSFTRIIVVLAILRQAMGTAQTPSNQIMIGLALFLTAFIMMPVFDRMNTVAIQPYMEEKITFQVGLERAQKPLRDFMMAQTRETDLELFAKLSGRESFNSPDDVPFSVLMPAFATSELKTAFQIGFMLFIPFLVIDIVVASVLMSMGMMMLSPMIISLPFKIMLFVLIDGWALVVATLARSFVP